MKKGLCDAREVAYHVHDSLTFKRCRRKWSFSSPFMRHLQPRADKIGVSPNLWFGSGFHFALEDYHGYHRFDTPVEAFKAYVDSFAPEELPVEVEDYITLGEQMLDYYTQWEATHSKWKTVWVDGAPLVEKQFSLVLDEVCYWQDNVTGKRYYGEEVTEAIKSTCEYVEVVAHGTIDRVVEDEHGDWWVLDYKTAKAFNTAKLAMDTQISWYCWAAEQYLDHPIAGMLYIQCSKTPPKEPKITKTGVSTDKRQATTRELYKQSLINYYGELQAAPAKNIEFLNDLCEQETENGNRFIRYDWVERNETEKVNIYNRINTEIREFLFGDIALYPNPTMDCSWDCPFKDMCLAMECGADWTTYLDNYEQRQETMSQEIPTWEKRLYRKHQDKYPEEYAKYCKEGTDSIEDFMKAMEEN